MRVDFVSDLHFNHWMQWMNNQLKWEKRTRKLTERLIANGNGEVLVIAGDFGEWNCQALWILDEVSKHYERVYFTYGNHDLYLLTKGQKKKYKDSINRLNELVEKASKIDNVIPLIKTVDIYKGKTFAGDMMCYLPKSFEDWEFFKEVSNDSDLIHIKGYTVEEGIEKLWRESQEWYTSIEDTKIDVFVSHVPPISNPYSPFKPNTCYMVDVPYINADNWVFGHDHFQRQFEKAGVKFHTNAIGYPQHYDYYPRANEIPNQIVDTYKKFELKTFTI